LKIVECVPNFSEGRRSEVIDSIRKVAGAVPGVTILDCENDPNHNRMVLTFFGPPEAVKDAALASSAEAIKSIDLRTHKGEHPRMGAVDVVPFVPIRDVTMAECIALAKEFALEYSNRFNVPVFLYETAATRPERKDLAKVREGQFEGLRELIGKDPAKDPDYGPRAIHPTAGATAVGARPILIAYNVNLKSSDLSIAKKIAHLVRGRDGGLPTVKALGFELHDRSIVQVSMNITDYKVSSVTRAFQEVSKRASEIGVEVLESEIVGLVPMDALVDAADQYLKLANFSPNQIIENRIFNIASSVMENAPKKSDEVISDFMKLSLEDFSSSVASKDPVPGGGSVSAYAGALAASLVAMVCRLTLGRKAYESNFDKMTHILAEAEESRLKLLELVNRDSTAYMGVSKALAMPKSTEEEKTDRSRALNNALKEATEIPLETLRTSYSIEKLAREVIEIGNKNARSDAQTAVELSRAAARGALSNVKVNLDSLSADPQYVASVKSQLESIIPVLESSKSLN
jgi:glutamate formiminotransferase / formiminotetrahydrofolate cyclodeaminase